MIQNVTSIMTVVIPTFLLIYFLLFMFTCNKNIHFLCEIRSPTAENSKLSSVGYFTFLM